MADDFEPVAEKTWTIPGWHLMSRKGAERPDHTVPLTERMIALLSCEGRQCRLLTLTDVTVAVMNVRFLRDKADIGLS